MIKIKTWRWHLGLLKIDLILQSIGFAFLIYFLITEEIYFYLLIIPLAAFQVICSVYNFWWWFRKPKSAIFIIRTCFISLTILLPVIILFPNALKIIQDIRIQGTVALLTLYVTYYLITWFDFIYSSRKLK